MEERDNVFYTLCNRFKTDVLNKCEINCARFNQGVSIAEEICNRTFENYIKKPSFCSSKANLSNIDTAFKLYLYAISYYELINFLRIEEKKSKGHFYDGSEQIITDLPYIPEEKLKNMDVTARVKIEAIKSLTPEQRCIYLTYQAYERRGCNLPKKLQEELRLYLGINRQDRIRALKKQVITIINAHLAGLEISLKHDSNGN